MGSVLTIARKELRAVFTSPVALLFLGAFWIVTLFVFFTQARFFARNIADVRPLFEWLPSLLLFLVSALTMRMWSEERKMGTLELLTTLPIPTTQLVAGKFLAACAMVVTALAFTLPLPLMVEWMGGLDWGPVVGGYVGALLLGAAYAAIGLAVSARTDNQVVALLVSLGVGVAFLAVGSPEVTGFFTQDTARVLEAFGLGARFESIERGVFDARDALYYLGVVAVALTWNVLTLEEERLDQAHDEGRRAGWSMRTLALLVALNAVALNVWMAPVSVARVDLTEHGDYSLEPVTLETLRGLDEPLLVEGLFSARTHPLLAPLVPQIRDQLAEVAQAVGADRVRVNILDPSADEELEQRVREDYGVESVPFQVADRTQQAVVNSFFHVVVRYGDHHEVLAFQDLIDVRADDGEVEVRLRNFEYDFTRAVRRVSRDFQSLDAVIAGLDEPATITLFVSPDTLPEEFRQVADWARAIGAELAGRGEALSFEEVDPTGDQALIARLAADYAVRPLAVDLFATTTFYLDVVIERGDRVERIVPRAGMTEGDVRRALEAAVRRVSPNQLTTVGIVTAPAQAPPPTPGLPMQLQQPGKPADFQLLEQLLGQNYEVERLELGDGVVPAHVDALIVGKTGRMSDEQLYAIDQFLMRGGSLIALAGRTEVSAQGRGGLSASRLDTRLEELLETWGVEVGDELVLDPQNASFPVPVEERRGRFVLRRVELMPYPFFPDIRGDGFDREHPVLAGLNNVTMPWSSPLRVVEGEGREATTLLETSPGSWARASRDIQPDFDAHPDAGFAPTGATGPRAVAVTVTGAFDSHFADRPSPLFGAEQGEQAGGGEEAGEGEPPEADRTGRTIKSSLPGARLAVLGSSEVASDLMLTLAQRTGGEIHRGNLTLLQNLVDWSTQDTDLLAIRGSGAFARTLPPMDDEERRAWELGQYAVVLAALIALGLAPWWRRRRVVPLTVEVNP
jgi:ABC-2 type transport system permease protein